jgi:hypothetical protein
MMIAQVLLLLCSIHVILSFAPPKISETFSTTVNLFISDEEGDHEGVGKYDYMPILLVYVKVQ